MIQYLLLFLFVLISCNRDRSENKASIELQHIKKEAPCDDDKKALKKVESKKKQESFFKKSSKAGCELPN